MGLSFCRGFLWVMVVFGMTNIITRSSLFSSWREWTREKLGTKFFGCPMCVGFWVGVFWHLLGLHLSGPFQLDIFASGLAASGVCWILHVVLVALGSNKL